jgi:hypothetical protein
MRLLAFTLLVAASAAQANPALHGTWSTALEGQPYVVVFKPDGSGSFNGKPLKWQAMGKLLFVQAQGEQAQSYSWDVKDGKLSVAGGNLNGVVTLTRGTAGAHIAAAKAAVPTTNGQELVGKWCLMSTFTANSGGSQRTTCFELKPDYTYTYRHEGSMSGGTGSTASQSSDAGRWKVSGSQLVATSQSGRTSTYALEKRNHPRNKRDPMICLNGECYVTFYNKPAW